MKVQDEAEASEDSATRPLIGWSVETHCYLCGMAFVEKNWNRDHVPPRRVFPSAIRRALTSDLLTLRTHVACQQAFARDEEYFFNSLLPNALAGPLGPMLSEDFKALIARDSPAKKLSETIKRNFDTRPSGLILPGGLVVLRVDGDRLTRVVWKIVRGLFAVEYGRFLPEDTARKIEIVGPFDREVPEHIIPLIARPRSGHTLTCFGQTFADSNEVKEWDGAVLYMCLLEFWGCYLLYAAFHDPDCNCERCARPAS
jgi:hypothetical protein